MTLKQALKHFRTQTRLADALGISQAAVAQWGQRGYIPPVRQYQIQVVSRGKLRADKGAA